MLDEKTVSEIRKDFPALSLKVQNKPLIYFDNAATTHKPWSVIKKVEEFYTSYNANVHSGLHTLSEKATFALNQVRQKTASFIGSPTPEQVIFTSGATESSNIIASSLTSYLQEDDEIILSYLEHNSQSLPWIHLAQQKKTKTHFLTFDENGLFDISIFEKTLNSKIKLIALTYVSNFLGTIQPIKTIVLKAKKVNPNVIIVIDAAQAIPYLPIDVQELGVDFLFFSAHKMLGPNGVGILWGKKHLLESIHPYKLGGGALERLQENRLTLKPIPDKFESGTPNTEGIIGLGAAIDYLSQIGIKNIQHYEKLLNFYLRERLKEVKSFELVVPKTSVSHSIAMATGYLKERNSHDVVALLDSKGIAVRSGLFCTHLILQQNQSIPLSLRASLYFYNTKEEIDTFIKSLKEVEKTFSCF